MMQQISMPFDAFSFAHGVWDAFGTELALLMLFCAGFILFRCSAVQQVIFGPQQKWKVRAPAKKFPGQGDNHVQNMPGWHVSAKQLEANWAAGRADLVLAAWPAVEHFTLGAFRAVIEALISTRSEGAVVGAVQRILSKHDLMCTQEAMRAALDALPDSCSRVAGDVRAAFAAAAAPAEGVGASTIDPVEQGHMQQISRAVQQRQLAKAMQYLFAMRDAGYRVPASCMLQFARFAIESEEGRTVLRDLPSQVMSAEAVTALLEHAGKVGDAALLRDMYKRVAKDLALLSHQGCEALLRSFAALGDSRSVEVFDEVLQSGFQPSENLLIAVISLCADSRHVQMAEHALSYARKMHGRASIAMYSAMIKVYGSARLFEKTCNLYEIMQRDGVHADTVVYGSLIKAAVESGRLELARQLFRESGNPDLLNYMSLIRAAGRERDVPKALQLLEELEAAPLAIDVTAYNCVLEVCVASGNRSASEDLLKRMEEKGQVDVVSYNTYLKLLFAQSLRSEVRAVLESMRRRGLSPNAVTYNSLVKDAVARQDLQGAWHLIDQMEKAEVKPDAFTCSILMKCVKHTCCVEDVDKIIQLIERAKITPDEVLVNCLLDACVRLRNIPRLTQVLEQFKATGVVPSPHACAMLIKAYGHARRLDCALALWRELIEERKVAPNEEVFASMVDACLANGHLQHAVAVFREMKHAINDFAKGAAMFSALVKSCIQQNQTKLAMEIYDELQVVSFTCNKVTYNSLIDALVRQGDMDRATSLFRDMTLNAVMPDLISYSTLIKGHCSRGDLEQGLALLGTMQRRGIAADAIVFNSILDGCAHKQMRTLTEQVLKDMEAAGIAPSNFTLSILVKLYGRCNDLDTAFSVVDLYPKKYGFALNAQVYTCLMSACIANGALSRALDVHRGMSLAGCVSDGKTYQTLLSGCVRHGDLDAAARLMEEALTNNSPAFLDREVIESVLLAAARRGRATDLGQQMLETLQLAGVHVSDRAVAMIHRGGDEPKDRMMREPRPYMRRPVRAAA
mmetsp:Transcript_159223/g.296865  ORF Transcript_159223/g.296865 Transcript_159223/m.296865 type:complete len:1024 (+) Transcript_159223:108-3179(+)